MKPFWESKTFWFNLVGLTVVVLQYAGTINLISADKLAGILGFANIALRFFTSEPVTFSKPIE